MIFCFPLNFLAQPLSQVMDSFIPQPSSSATPPNHHPHPPLPHSIHSPIHPYNFTHPFTNPATSPLSVHLLNHPSTFPPIHPISCSPIHALFYPPSVISFTVPSLHPALSREPTGYLSSFIICPSCTSIYPSSWGPACGRPQVLSSTCSIK